MTTISRVELARLRKQVGKRVPIQLIDDVSDPIDDGQFVTLVLISEGAPALAVVLTTSNFYACLGKVIETAMPGDPKSH